MNHIHTVFRPSGEGPHPTILAMHGRGANAMDLLGIAPHICSGRFLMICPQAPLEVSLGPGGGIGYAWFSSSREGKADVDAILLSRNQLKEFIEACLECYPIDPARFVVLGFSQGGVLAYSLAFEEPKRFAALIAMSTRLAPELLERLPAASSAQKLPTLIQHGSNDSMIPVDRAREADAALQRLSIPVTYHEYPMGHEISGPTLNDLSNWLAEKVL